MSKIQNPTVLIMKRENSDTYAVAITNASDNFHDAELMASMEPDMHDDAIDTWSKTGYYMAEEIQKLRQRIEWLESKNLKYKNLVDTYDWHRQRLHTAMVQVIEWNRQEAEDRTGNADRAESYACVKELRAALAFCENDGVLSLRPREQCIKEISALLSIPPDSWGPFEAAKYIYDAGYRKVGE